MTAIALFLSMQFHPTDTGLAQIRAAYYSAAQKEISADAFAKKLEDVNEQSSAVMLAYKSMALVLEARDAFNPYTKMSSFNKGKAMLENAVNKSPDNVEVRFLRFCVQSNAPFFLGYSGNIADDKAVILNKWSALRDEDLKQKIKEFMTYSNAATAAEKQMLQ